GRARRPHPCDRGRRGGRSARVAHVAETLIETVDAFRHATTLRHALRRGEPPAERPGGVAARPAGSRYAATRPAGDAATRLLDQRVTPAGDRYAARRDASPATVTVTVGAVEAPSVPAVVRGPLAPRAPLAVVVTPSGRPHGAEGVDGDDD